MKKFTSSFAACAALFLLGIGVAPLANAAPWTFFSSGTISTGYDTTGVFGNGDLTGQTYSHSATLDPFLYSSQEYGTEHTRGAGQLTGTATDTLTINGVSKTYTFDLSQSHDGTSYLQNTLTQQGGIGDWYRFDEAYQSYLGYTTDGTFLSAYKYMNSMTNSLNLGLSFNQVWSHNLQSGDYAGDYFNASGNNGETSLWANPTFMSINSPIAAVPEPETYAMLLAGLGLLGFTARRKKLAM